MTTQIKLADFNGYPIQLVHINNQSYLTAETVGKALGLKYPANSINKAYRRHADEFMGDMTCEDKLSLQGEQSRNYRLFSLDGARMLAFFVQTDTAKQFRRWVLEMLNQQPINQAKLAFLQKELLRQNPIYQFIKRYKGLGLKQVEIAKLLDKSPDTIRRYTRKMEGLGLINPPKNLAKRQQLALNFLGGE